MNVLHQLNQQSSTILKFQGRYEAIGTEVDRPNDLVGFNKIENEANNIKKW